MFISTMSRHILVRGIVAFAAIAAPALAQFDVAGHSAEVHGFASQGFAYSNDNNYLTMSTSTGSFAFTDAGVNVSTRLTDRLRVGAQAYIQEIGNLGRGQVKLDWALGDYRVSDSFGIRVGKVKTVLGLYNDTQDVDSLHTWALMPQSIYRLDLRETSLAHLGADLYGSVSIPHLGNLAYTLYAGYVSIDRSGGYTYSLETQGLNPRKLDGKAAGADLKWTTPVHGLLLGASYIQTHSRVDGSNLGFGVPFRLDANPDRNPVFSAQYSFRALHVDAEYSRHLQLFRASGLYLPGGQPYLRQTGDRRAWYVAGAYRLSKRLELGTYYSRYFPEADSRQYGAFSALPAGRHIFDNTFTARVDISTHWDLKLEEHLIDGYGDPISASGFYPQQNPSGLKPKTNLFILRTGFSF